MKICIRLGFAAGLALALAGVLQGATRPNWHAMGTSPCDWSGAVSGPDGQLDGAGTVQRLKQYGFSCFVWVAQGNNWGDLERLLPATDQGGIGVWAVLLPPSEGKSQPYGADYVRWMQVLARLVRAHPSLRGVNIDDLDQGTNPATFTRRYVCELYRAKQAIAPQLLFVPTVYDLDRSVANRLAGCVDGAWLWWTNLEKNTGLPSSLDNVRLAVAGRFPIYAGVYASSTSWHRQAAPLPRILREALAISCRHADGAIIWELPLTPQPNPLLDVAREYTPGGSSPLAGKCGQGWTHGVEATH